MARRKSAPEGTYWRAGGFVKYPKAKQQAKNPLAWVAVVVVVVIAGFFTSNGSSGTNSPSTTATATPTATGSGSTQP
ncbi:hypothetical protein GCM10010442_49790 [Kitasatospora kifunensis]